MDSFNNLIQITDQLDSLLSLIGHHSPDLETKNCIGIAWDVNHELRIKLFELRSNFITTETMISATKTSFHAPYDDKLPRGFRIQSAREACGLTTAELARLLDLDEDIIIQWESGEYEPTISMLIPLANVLGCDPLSLLTEKNTAAAVRVNAPEAQEESIGARIEAARKKLGLTEADLARMIHSYNDHINDWECGICEVPAGLIVPLANALHCDPIWLLTGGITPPEQPKSEEQSPHDASQQACPLSREALLRKNQYQW
ncbi:TPA: helix-turn-helix domain-containing protein [Escherichia coli]|nr:helix-turn-helix domain-containing protein [Escherichia coli]